MSLVVDNENAFALRHTVQNARNDAGIFFLVVLSHHAFAAAIGHLAIKWARLLAHINFGLELMIVDDGDGSVEPSELLLKLWGYQVTFVIIVCHTVGVHVVASCLFIYK